MLTTIRGALVGLTRTVAALWRPPEFTCGDCERSDRCGLPPSERCIVKAAQITRGDWAKKRHTAKLAQW